MVNSVEVFTDYDRFKLTKKGELTYIVNEMKKRTRLASPSKPNQVIQGKALTNFLSKEEVTHVCSQRIHAFENQ